MNWCCGRPRTTTRTSSAACGSRSVRGSPAGSLSIANRFSCSRNAAADPRFKLFAELPEDRFEAFLSVPLISQGRLVGVINLQSREACAYSDREIGLISTLGFLVGAEIGRARLESENTQLTNQLEVRKVVERAKGILQHDLRLTEEAAYQMLRRESQQRRKSMKDVAEAIILSHAIKQS